ncbi:unnamed protein product [Phytophthora fragariaefolia]|uniref:Unnamed protein product n=1 Tax=Phytophthora fragariaefolia TaxID=1490495 RepID=A0A9W7D166_9STRA|nr:unnamed protein product [Phytophthora fragariaefolia]
MPSDSQEREQHRHQKQTNSVHHLSQSHLELLALTKLFRATGGRLPTDGGRATTWGKQTGWDRLLAVGVALRTGEMPIPKTTTMQAYFVSVFGVKWERNHVMSIDLSGNGLTGAFPTEIAQLRFLTTLKMRNNPKLRGTLPCEIYSMPHLKFCYVDGTKIESALPYNSAHSFQITQLKPEIGRAVGTAMSTVRFCTGDSRTGHLIHWMTDMTEAEMYMVHSSLKKLHESADPQIRRQIKCTASNATGPERAAAATKLQRIYRARIARTKFLEFLHSLVEIKVDPTTGYIYYVNARTGEATWEKPKFLGPDTELSHSGAGDETIGNNSQDGPDAWKPYDDGNGNMVSFAKYSSSVPQTND